MQDKNIVSFSIKSKIWLESNQISIFGSGDYKLLKTLEEYKNITKAAELCGYSYRYAWNKLKKIELKTKQPIIKIKRGGAGGGAIITLTEWGVRLLKIFQFANQQFSISMKKINQELITHFSYP